MPMQLIDQNSLFGKINRPEWDCSGELDAAVIEMYDALYDHRMAAALSDLDPSLTWNEDTSEIWSDGGTAISPNELRTWWQETSNSIAGELMDMDDEELHAAYNAEI